MKETLVIGGAGFIGSRFLHDFGCDDVSVFDNLSSVVHSPQSVQNLMATDVDFIHGDITALTDIRALFARGVPENLILLAAETGTGRSLQNCALNSGVNVMGTALVLDELSRLGHFPKRVILTSSRAIYGEGPYRHNDTGALHYPAQRSAADLRAGRFGFDGLTSLAMNAQAHLPNPSNIYGTTKLCQENLLRNWAQSFQVDAYILRLQNVYGAGQSLTNPYTGVLIQFLHHITQNRPVQIYENGGITRDFVHVSDVTRAIQHALTGVGAPGIYDIGSGQRKTLFAVAEALCDLSGGPLPERCDQYRLGDVRHAVADISAAQAKLGWTPEISLQEGLAELITFFADQQPPAPPTKRTFPVGMPASLAAWV